MACDSTKIKFVLKYLVVAYRYTDINALAYFLAHLVSGPSRNIMLLFSVGASEWNLCVAQFSPTLLKLFTYFSLSSALFLFWRCVSLTFRFLVARETCRLSLRLLQTSTKCCTLYCLGKMSAMSSLDSAALSRKANG